FGRVGDVRDVRQPHVEAMGARAELAYGPVTEWLENRMDGIEQGWSVPTSPIGVDPLWIGLAVEGDLSLRVEDGGRSGVLVDSSGTPQLRYSALRVLDSEGCELEARLEPSPTGPGIRIDDRGARYP